MIKETLCSLLLTMSAQNIDDNFNLPKHLENYREHPIYQEVYTNNKDHIFGLITYDVNKDGIPDAYEAYNCLGINEYGQFVMESNPFMYGFDLNNDKKITDYETFIDKNRDGLNGNEKPLKKSNKVYVNNYY